MSEEFIAVIGTICDFRQSSTECLHRTDLRFTSELNRMLRKDFCTIFGDDDGLFVLRSPFIIPGQGTLQFLSVY